VVAQEFDQVVTVTPSLGSTLPIAGAVVGGPVVGAAMLVVQGLVDKQVDQIGAVRYSVQGPWSSPDIRVLAGRPLREVIQDAAKAPPAPAPATPAGQQAPAPVEGRTTDDAGRPTSPQAPSFRLPDFH
jgi:ribosomal protein L12E/L44/L45/RPP1/RPP2